jgi:predicted ATPase
MPAYILTGTPGSGKTAILRQLEINGHAVVEEAATDVIALRQALGDPLRWDGTAFIDRIVELQRSRRLTAPGDAIFDRSPVCTLALSRYAGLAPTPKLLAELETTANFYERGVFLVRNLGFVESTAARRITYPESLEFEKIHEQAYADLGYELIEVPAAPLPERVALIERCQTSRS